MKSLMAMTLVGTGRERFTCEMFDHLVVRPQEITPCQRVNPVVSSVSRTVVLVENVLERILVYRVDARQSMLNIPVAYAEAKVSNDSHKGAFCEYWQVAVSALFHHEAALVTGDLNMRKWKKLLLSQLTLYDACELKLKH
ncbi:unnamed protein product [Soboliphyme baturini]|uniref:Endo/exonuclease/phosphatase domain-containing protein n=1 Tax=Soboliphyme baturini TaxID=241478 RepID=A0A183IT30_9BILA|nr:unnamed protein product [Soboliphyme baturini]